MTNWNPSHKDLSDWKRRYSLLVQFIKREGHTRVPFAHQEEGFPLYLWIAQQQKTHRDETMLSEHRRLLEQLPGWKWQQPPSPNRNAAFDVPAASRETKTPRRFAVPTLSIPVDEAAEKLWETFFGLGSVDAVIAREKAARELFDASVLSERAPKPGSDADRLVQEIFDTGMSLGFFDIPTAGRYRAILANPADLEADDWRMCLLDVLDDAPLTESKAVAATAAWAEETLGIKADTPSKKMVVKRRIKAAIDTLVSTGDIERTVKQGTALLSLRE